MKYILLVLLALASTANADEKQYYIRDSAGNFQKVDKLQAVTSIIKSGSQVVACQDLRLTKKLTLKAVSKNDD